MKKKGCCIGCVGFVALFAGIFALVMHLTGPVVECADLFLAKLGQGKVSEAYQSTASGFKKETSEAEFAVFVKAAHLDQYARSSWTQRSMENNVGRVEGRYTLGNGRPIGIVIEMIQEGDVWKVEGVTPDASVFEDVPTPPTASGTPAPTAEPSQTP